MDATIEFTSPLVLHFGSTFQKLSAQEFYEFCRQNPELRIELTARGDLVIMPPTGGETGRQNLELSVSLGNWAKADGSGIGFDSSTGFTLPSGARRSPDVSWVLRSRWVKLTQDEREQFPPLCPDFVLELRSRRDSLSVLSEKMEEYIANGARLAWLVDPVECKLHIFAPGTKVRSLDKPASLRGDPVLPGFVLDLTAIWP